LLTSVCGEELAGGPICCNSDQLEVLRDNLNDAEPLITSCPACRNNFRSFFCHFTCSPIQASFVNVTSTQISSTGQTAVKSLDFFVSERHGQSFFDSCKDVKVGATNGYVMDLIGEGAKDYSSFLKSLGQEKPLGSPFQIHFPSSVPVGMVAFDNPARNCADSDLSSRCTCVDCPHICPTLPDIPALGDSCHIGALSCLSFFLILAYSLCLVVFMTGFSLQTFMRRKEERKYNRLSLAPEPNSDTPLSPRSYSRELVGASSLARYHDGEQSSPSTSGPRNAGRGVTLLDPLDSVQPRQYRLNVKLRRMFYKLGLFTASYPSATFSIMFIFMFLLNIGWKNFGVETDPVRLWVAPDSESKIQKDFFDQNFGPFYRPQQIFVTSATNGDHASVSQKGKPVLSWDHLKFLFSVETDIRNLPSSPNSYSLSDVCFKPAGPQGACVFQSITAWFGDDIDDTSPDSWAERVEYCANAPVDCLPDFQQPLLPKYVLGGVPGDKYLEAEALVVTIIVSDSLDLEVQEKAMEWERALAEYLAQLKERAPSEAGLEISYSTGISLEEEINKSTNMDVKIVVLSYLAMFFYVALTLGAGHSGNEEGVAASLHRWAINFPRLFSPSSSSSLSVDPRNTPHVFPRLPRKVFVGSKFMLGLFGIALVILSVASSVGFFSAVGVKVTLIIAEVIPFLVLAVGVDNVFILVHELGRQNILHGPNAGPSEQALSYPTPISPTSRRSQFDSSHTESIDAASLPLHLTPEERVARTLAKMGPSIMLSSVTETVAFALGALVPMPAVRNFALYAAGSVLLNALLQVTVFVSAMALDLRRLEVS